MEKKNLPYYSIHVIDGLIFFIVFKNLKGLNNSLDNSTFKTAVPK